MATTAYTSTHTGAEIDAGVDRAMTVPAVSASDNNKIMMVQSGAWAAKTITMQVYYSGSSAPSSSLGNNGDIYIQTS